MARLVINTRALLHTRNGTAFFYTDTSLHLAVNYGIRKQMKIVVTKDTNKPRPPT
jgi:hypothetical protein